MRDTILVTGSRDFADENALIGAILKHGAASHIDRVVHGACPTGADKLATDAALQLRYELFTYPVDHALDGPWPAAGPRRNERMLKAEADRIAVVLAFTSNPDGSLTRGTLDCVTRALRMGLPVFGARP